MKTAEFTLTLKLFYIFFQSHHVNYIQFQFGSFDFWISSLLFFFYDMGERLMYKIKEGISLLTLLLIFLKMLIIY